MSNNPDELTDEILAKAEVEQDANELDESEEGQAEDQPQLTREEELETQVAELKDKWLRAHAELENVRKIAIREKREATQYAVTNFARDMLEVSDNFRRALDTIPDEIPKDDVLKPFVDGVKMTEQQLISIFTRHKIEEIKAENEQFNPNLHQAMFEMPNTDVPNNTVMQVVQAGFTISGRLLRPAMVGVAKGGPVANAGTDVDEQA